MITTKGFSKDPTIQPEGIVVTWGQDMLKEKGLLRFIRHFEQCMKTEDGLWIQFCKNAPQQDILYVYVIVCGRLQYRCLYGGHRSEPSTMYDAEGKGTAFDNPHILLAGPFVKAPFYRELKGFQGFRYCTKLF